MISNKKILAIITARAGSKRIPDKNLKPLFGKPLIDWTIEAAKKSKYIDNVILSSDGEKILERAKYHKINLIERKAELATDTASSVDVVLDVLNQYNDFDYLILLQPTSPLRTREHIDELLEKFFLIKEEVKACLSVYRSKESPYHMFFEDNKHILHPVLGKDNLLIRTQDHKPAFILNGAIYLCNINTFLKERSFVPDGTTYYEMPKSLSVDIDTAEDLLEAEKMASELYSDH